MSTIKILRLTNVMSYKYICFHQIWSLYRPKESEVTPQWIVATHNLPNSLCSANERFDVWTVPLKHLTLKCQKLFELLLPFNCVNDTNRKRYSDPRNISGLSVNFSARREYAASFRFNYV